MVSPVVRRRTLIESGRITRADLDSLKPGFGSYLERWLEHQEYLWQQENVPIDRNSVDKVLALLAFAFGPLEEPDLLGLLDRFDPREKVFSTAHLLAPLRRFVFGDGKSGTGYVLSHPKIGHHLQEERLRGRATELRGTFAAWGLDQLRAINAGQIRAEQTSSYALQFLPSHLEAINAPPEDYIIMVENGWRLAWEHFEGGQRGFASAVRTAWSKQPRKGADLRLACISHINSAHRGFESAKVVVRQ